ncbi:MAG TPA: pentapeptide repeat-containing protein [Solirubrobacteraceae bacterium]|nr:pentapeptide repeat-containing protein [Solirubrobacteraceae bacterium]
MDADRTLQAPDLPALEPVVLTADAGAPGTPGVAGSGDPAAREVASSGEPGTPGELELSAAAISSDGGMVAVRRLRLSECELSAVTFAPGRAPGMTLTDVVAVDCGLSNLDGREGSLRRVALTRSQLVGFGFDGGELRDVRLTDCSLELASLAGTRLRDVVFERVNLTEASFMDARLEAVAFVDCRLQGTDFRGARVKACAIRGASLDGVLGVESLRGVRMPWPDVLDSAAALAAALGITVEE